MTTQPRTAESNVRKLGMTIVPLRRWLEEHPRAWKTLIALPFVVLGLRLINIHDVYNTRMPRHPQPEFNRTLPLVAVNRTTVYITPEERRTWLLVHYEGYGGALIMFAIIAVSQRRAARAAREKLAARGFRSSL